MFILKYTLYSKTFLKSDNRLHYLFSINYFSFYCLVDCLPTRVVCDWYSSVFIGNISGAILLMSH